MFVDQSFRANLPFFDLEFGDALDLGFCHEMTQSAAVFPYTKHKEECVVCFCKTADELYELLEEHSEEIEINSFSPEILNSLQISGPRALVLTLSDLRDKFNIDANKTIAAFKMILYLRKLHAEAM